MSAHSQAGLYVVTGSVDIMWVVIYMNSGMSLALL